MGKIKHPSKQTLKKYGLELRDWLALLNECNSTCPICERKFWVIYGKSKRPLYPCIEHYHARNFRNMKPENKRIYIRGLTCSYCNRRRLSKGMNLATARNLVIYFERFERKNRTV